MKTKKSMTVLLVSLLTVAAGGLIAQQGGMMPAQGMGMPMQPPTPEQIKAQMKEGMKMLIGQVDGDKDGELSLDEYKKMYDMITGGAPQDEEETEEEKADRLKTEFEDADEDDNDSLTLDEFVDYAMKKMEEEANGEESEEDDADSEDGEEVDDEDADEDEEEE